jgi:hypothetical protein
MPTALGGHGANYPDSFVLVEYGRHYSCRCIPFKAVGMAPGALVSCQMNL